MTRNKRNLDVGWPAHSALPMEPMMVVVGAMIIVAFWVALAVRDAPASKPRRQRLAAAQMK
jgi:hypothetical protein